MQENVTFAAEKLARFNVFPQLLIKYKGKMFAIVPAKVNQSSYVSIKTGE